MVLKVCNPPDCPILCNLMFDNFILAEGLFEKSLPGLETCGNLWGKLFSSLESPITFDRIFKSISVPFFIPDFNLLSCKLDNFTFKTNLQYFFVPFERS